MRRFFVFLLHLFNGTVATMGAGVVVHKLFVQVAVSIRGGHGVIDFEILSFLPAFICVGLLVGYVTYVRVGGKNGVWIFLVPIVALAIRIITFRPVSAFDSGISTGWNYFFGPAICSAPFLMSLAHTAQQCVNRMAYLGSIGSAIAYSAGVLAADMGLWPHFSAIIKNPGIAQEK